MFSFVYFHGYFKLGKHVELVILLLFLYYGLYQEVISAKSFGFTKYEMFSFKEIRSSIYFLSNIDGPKEDRQTDYNMHRVCNTY